MATKGKTVLASVQSYLSVKWDLKFFLASFPSVKKKEKEKQPKRKPFYNFSQLTGLGGEGGV